MTAFLWAAAFNTAMALFFLAGIIAIEFVAPIERFTLRQRIPGTLMAIAGGIGSTAVIWPLNLLWHHVGLAKMTVPLAHLLAPLGIAGVAFQIVFGALLVDFLRYWRHRAEHKWFWPIHAVHHSPTELHAANSLGHPFQVIPEFLFVSVPLSLVTFGGPGVPIFVGMIFTVLNLYIHSPIDFHFGLFRRVLIDNRFHRIHHSTEERHLERNFGVAFSLWDALFGTAISPTPGEWPKVGVPGLEPPRTVGDFLGFPATRFLRLGRRTYRGAPPADCLAAPTSTQDSPQPSGG